MARIIERWRENARPTIPLPETTSSGAACGFKRITPRRPPSDAATYKFPLASKANPWGRPSPR